MAVGKPAVIIGGTGQIGTACAHRLAQHGWDVVALSRGEREVPDQFAEQGVEHRTLIVTMPAPFAVPLAGTSIC